MSLFNGIVFRKSNSSDEEQIRSLLFKCFGEMAEKRGAYERISDGRYSIAEIEKKIIAISGIIMPKDSLFNGYEITWTCCDEEYRHRGIVTEILKRCIAELPEDKIPIYCDCWRINYHPESNLASTMKNLGMKLFFTNIAVYNKAYMKVCETCPYKDESQECHCVSDLYKKDRK